MTTKTKRDRTGELIDVKMDNVGKLANRLVEIRAHQESLQQEYDMIETDLVQCLQESGRQKINVRGFVLRVKEVQSKEAVSRILVSRERE